MEHSFNVETAKKYGVEEAIFIKHLQFWIIKNKANGKNRKPCIINGVHCYRTFTYNSAIALSKIFLYLSESQIRRLVTSLKNKNVIIVEKYNDNPYDKTNWYAFVNESEFVGDEYSVEDFDDEAEEEKDFTPEKKKYSLKKKDSEPPAKCSAEFNKAWTDYGGIGSKHQANLEWKKLSAQDKVSAAEGVSTFVKNNPEIKYRPHFCRYLKHRRWEDEDVGEKEFDDYDYAGGGGEKNSFDFDDD